MTLRAVRITIVALTLAAPLPAAPPPQEAEALLDEADRLRDGRAGTTDQRRARELYERAAATGDPLAVAQLAELIQRGVLGYHIDLPRAAALLAPHVTALERAALAGVARAQYLAGLVVFGGIGVTVDRVAAARWFELAAAQNQVESMVWLGWMHATGNGVTADGVAAERFYRRAIEAGSCQVKYELGTRSLVGEGVPTDRAAGESWLRQAAACRYPRAMSDLGRSLIEGRVLDRNVEEGTAWLERAEAIGFAPAATALGELAMNGGAGGQREPEVALAHLLDGLQRGESDAPSRLIDLLES